ncbi:hypothetical protein M9Y10_005733 [Tritrichomonas musculus]|uniref:Uncharacterized protein n=1 Tax=Tritrichomonas musculus TaxID=1915356 RepID=A0ABR2JCX4_9EUKA
MNDNLSSGSFSSSSSNLTLKDHLSKIQQISLNNENSTSVVQEFESKIKENLDLKENCINLQSQVQIANETNRLQEAEYAFRVIEYEAEIKSLKKIEEELRKALTKASQKNDDSVHDIEIKFRGEIDKLESEKNDYIQSFQAQISRLRSVISELQSQNEILSEDLQRFRQDNINLTGRLEDQKKFYENKTQLLQNHIKTSEDSINEVSGAFRENQQNYEMKISQLQAQLLAAQRKIDDLQSENQVLSDKEQLLTKQVEKLIEEHNTMSNQIAIENSRNGQIKNENEKLQNQIDMLETDLKSQQMLLSKIEDNTKESRKVYFCSPLQKTRIALFKLIEQYNNQMADVVRQIYPDSNRDLKLRSVVLFVIFARRFLNNTRNESNICDNQGGLAIFSASDKMNSPLQLLVQAKNELTSVKVLLSDLQRKEIENTNQIEELSVKNKRDRAYQEALSIQLNSAKKCNQILHKKFNSFVRFHDAVIDYEAE